MAGGTVTVRIVCDGGVTGISTNNTLVIVPIVAKGACLANGYYNRCNLFIGGWSAGRISDFTVAGLTVTLASNFNPLPPPGLGLSYYICLAGDYLADVESYMGTTTALSSRATVPVAPFGINFDVPTTTSILTQRLNDYKVTTTTNNMSFVIPKDDLKANIEVSAYVAKMMELHILEAYDAGGFLTSDAFRAFSL